MFNVQCTGDEVGTHRGNTRNKWKRPSTSGQEYCWKKIGRAPANTGKLFRKLISSNMVEMITC